MHYQEKLDQIFANGSTWKHRTLRTVFDLGSHEYNRTTKAEKVDILKACVHNHFNLFEIIEGYKAHYEYKNPEAAKSVEYVVTDLLNEVLKG